MTYALIPGAGGAAWYWHRVEAELRRRGRDAVAVDLPADDDAAGLAEYADAVVAAVAGRADIVLVAQSLAGFSAPLVCERRPVSLLVLGRIPRGERFPEAGRLVRIDAPPADGADQEPAGRERRWRPRPPSPAGSRRRTAP